MNTTHKTDGDHNCIGCDLYQTLDGDAAPCCLNLIHWHGGTPWKPSCFVKTAQEGGDHANH